MTDGTRSPLPFLLYHRSTYKTGRLLARCLGIPYGHLGQPQPPRRLQRRLGQIVQARTLIRWGAANTSLVGAEHEEINHWASVLDASDKLTAFQVMREAGVLVPAFTADREEAEWLCLNTVLLGRTRHGVRGHGIVDYQPGETLGDHELYVRFIPNKREYRVHVFRGEVIRVQGKYLDVPDLHTELHIKNHSQGYRFRTPSVQLHRDRLDAAVNAVNALGLDFGAVDLLVGQDGLAYVLEVNTAPACSPLTARAYVEKFAEVLGVEPDYSHLEVEDEA